MQRRDLVIGVAVLFLAATSSGDPKFQSSYNQASAAETIDNYNEVRYKYQYAVDDPVSGVVNDRWEHRHGEYVKGAYSVLEPDGRVRTVDYEVDGPKGFHAIIRTQFPSNRLLSHLQLQRSLKQHRDPPVNVLTNQHLPTASSEFNNQRSAQLLHRDLPVNFHSISPNYYLSLVPGQRTNYRTTHNNPVTEAFIASSPVEQNFHGYYSPSTGPNTNVQRYGGSPADSARPSQFILPPPLPPSAYTQHTQAISAPVPSTQITRTYYGG